MAKIEVMYQMSTLKVYPKLILHNRSHTTYMLVTPFTLTFTEMEALSLYT